MDPSYPRRQKLDHNTPGWVEEPEYFITVCCQNRQNNSLCHPRIGRVAFESAQYLQKELFWNCELLVLMPDHLHLLVSFTGRKSMPLVMTIWKRWMAHRGKIRFQKGFFEHRLRSVASGCQKWTYIHSNPVRSGLTGDPLAWPVS